MDDPDIGPVRLPVPPQLTPATRPIALPPRLMRMEVPSMTDDERLDVLKRHTAQIMEHFDAIQIFATKENAEEQTTTVMSWGGGNWYARFGQVQEWIVQQNARAEIKVRREDDADDDS